MIEYLRDQLGITREDIAMYFGLSLHMVKSIEMGRRQLPMDSQDAVVALIEAIKAGTAGKPAVNPAPADNRQIRLMRNLHRQCSVRLRKYIGQLGRMQNIYARACATLAVYEALAQAHTPARNDDVRIRQKWAQKKVAETMASMQENNETAQEILSVEIAGLKSIIQRLEASSLFPFKTTK